MVVKMPEEEAVLSPRTKTHTRFCIPPELLHGFSNDSLSITSEILLSARLVGWLFGIKWCFEQKLGHIVPVKFIEKFQKGNYGQIYLPTKSSQFLTVGAS